MKTLFNILLLLKINVILNLDNSCKPGIHQMFVIINQINDNKNRIGLSKFNYLFILLSTPEEPTDIHIMFKGKFPVNVNIDLYEELVYNFIPKNPFCLTDLINERQGVILGDLYQYKPKNLILNGIYIEIEENIMKFPIDNEDLSNEFFLLNNYTPPSQYVFLLKKINKKGNQFFQIVNVKMIETKFNQNYCNNEDYDSKYNLTIGTIIEVKSQYIDNNYIMKDGLIYNGGILLPIYRNFILNDVQSFVCLLYIGNEYTEECFTE